MANNEENNQNQQNKGKGGPDASTNSGPVSGGGDNTRGENVPSREGSGGGAKKGKENPENGNRDEVTPQDPNANLTTTTRGADSTDKEFRNDQPNSSTLKSHKNSADFDDEKK